MKYKVTLDNKINFAPESETEEILQNIRTILSTRIGTVPLARDFGTTWEHIDKPYPVAKALMQSVVIDAITENEPRATVEAVEFDDEAADAMEGILRPIVIVSIGQDEEEEQ